MRSIQIGSLIVALCLVRHTHADDAADAKALLQRAIEAGGGAETLDQIKAVHFKMEGFTFEQGQKISAVSEWTSQGFDKSRLVVVDAKTKEVIEIEVVNGAAGWSQDDDGKTDALKGDVLQNARDTAYLVWATNLTPLKNNAFRLSTLPEIDVKGKKAAGLLVERAERPPLKLYFDKSTNLLIKVERRTKNLETHRPVVEETYYSDIREVNGTKQPFAEAVYQDGKLLSEMTSTTVQLFTGPREEKLFERP